MREKAERAEAASEAKDHALPGAMVILAGLGGSDMFR